MNNKSTYIKYCCHRATREQAYSLRICLRAPLAIAILHVIYHYVSLLLPETMGTRLVLVYHLFTGSCAHFLLHKPAGGVNA